MNKKYIITFNGVDIAGTDTKKEAMTILKSIDKENLRIKSIIAKLESEGQKVFKTVYVETRSGDMIHPVAQKGI